MRWPTSSAKRLQRLRSEVSSSANTYHCWLDLPAPNQIKQTVQPNSHQHRCYPAQYGGDVDIGRPMPMDVRGDDREDDQALEQQPYPAFLRPIARCANAFRFRYLYAPATQVGESVDQLVGPPWAFEWNAGLSATKTNLIGKRLTPAHCLPLTYPRCFGSFCQRNAADLVRQ